MVPGGCLAGATTHTLLHHSVQEDSREIPFFLQVFISKGDKNGLVHVTEVIDIQMCMTAMGSFKP